MSACYRISSVAAVLLTLGGCGWLTDDSSREPLAGTVTLAGEPLKKGSIEFVPASGGAVAARSLILEGKFNIPRAQGPAPGSYKVLIFTDGDRSRKDHDKDATPGTDSRPKSSPAAIIIISSNSKMFGCRPDGEQDRNVVMADPGSLT